MYKVYKDALDFINNNEVVKGEFEKHFGGRVNGAVGFDMESLFDGKNIDQRKCYEDFEKQIYSQADEINEELSKDDADVYEWLNKESLGDTEYTFDNNGFRSGEILLGFGGPNIYLDTGTATLKGRWGGMKVDAPICMDVIDKINDCLEEEMQYQMEHVLDQGRSM